MKSWIEISRARLKENVRAVQSAAGSGVELLAVIKADGYGHGAEVVAPVFAQAGVRWLGVTDAEEGLRVRARLESSCGLLIMCGSEPQDAATILQNGLTPVVWTVEHIRFLEKAARSAGHRVCVHLEVDTGMGRQGAAPGADLAGVVEELKRTRWVELEGLMTHLCESEVAGSAVTAAQLERFEPAIRQVAEAGLKPQYLHVGNSSAVDEGSTLPWIKRAAKSLGAKPMVRTGLAVYGHCLPVEQGEARVAARLKPVHTWKAPVIGVREIAAGGTVGYGATFTAARPMRLALLPVGYADGFRREASSGMGDGWVMVRKQKAPVVGRVSMNLTVVDVTEIDGVQVGDDAVLLGPGVTAEDHARWARTISYDILCGMKARLELR